MAKGTLNEQVYEKIKKDIMSLGIAPGTAVSVQKLADTYGSSRTPVREAVVRLQQEGLAIIKPHANTLIAPISRKRMTKERFIREALELSVADAFLPNASPLVIDTLEEVARMQQKAADRGRIAEFYRMDFRFHQILFETAGQELAYSVMAGSNTHADRLFYLKLKDGGLSREMTQAHGEIIEAVRSASSVAMKSALARDMECFFKSDQLHERYPEYFSD